MKDLERLASARHFRSSTSNDGIITTRDAESASLTRDELEHAIRAACDVAGDTEVYVLGSQAILGEFPEAHPDLRQSAEADIAPKNRPDQTDTVDGVLGELSTFHDTFGFYVHGIPLTAAVLPRGWEARAVKVQNENTNDFTGWCLAGHDLAASKLAAFRDKDREFVRTLLIQGLIKVSVLLERIRELERLSSDERERLIVWVQATARDLSNDLP